uniref:OTU domain-containing protein n=1 Tax=Spongospora subterranea TaxID=70186 RepID=A0A0H5QWD0_9EUKA|eukprot:CRZ06062.1 hypothetical protein [Spongospora subterranea]
MGRRRAKHKNDAKKKGEKMPVLSPMETYLAEKGLVLHPINADGDCLFGAIADQLNTRAREACFHTARIRAEVVAYIEAHESFFAEFLTKQSVEEYCAKMRKSGLWGGNMELNAAALEYSVTIAVHQVGRSPVMIVNPSKDAPVINIGYVNKQHYISCRPISQKNCVYNPPVPEILISEPAKTPKSKPVANTNALTTHNPVPLSIDSMEQPGRPISQKNCVHNPPVPENFIENPPKTPKSKSASNTAVLNVILSNNFCLDRPARPSVQTQHQLPLLVDSIEHRERRDNGWSSVSDRSEQDQQKLQGESNETSTTGKPNMGMASPYCNLNDVKPGRPEFDTGNECSLTPHCTPEPGTKCQERPSCAWDNNFQSTSDASSNSRCPEEIDLVDESLSAMLAKQSLNDAGPIDGVKTIYRTYVPVAYTSCDGAKGRESVSDCAQPRQPPRLSRCKQKQRKKRDRNGNQIFKK